MTFHRQPVTVTANSFGSNAKSYAAYIFTYHTGRGSLQKRDSSFSADNALEITFKDGISLPQAMSQACRPVHLAAAVKGLIPDTPMKAQGDQTDYARI